MLDSFWFASKDTGAYAFLHYNWTIEKNYLFSKLPQMLMKLEVTLLYLDTTVLIWVIIGN